MNANTLYHIYQTTRNNGASDLTIGLAIYKSEHPELKLTQQEDRAIREFMGRHGQALACAFPDPVAFAAAVAAAEEEDTLLSPP